MGYECIPPGTVVGTVNARLVADRVRQIVDDPAVLALVDQLRDDMDAREYCSIVIAITRILAADACRTGANSTPFATSRR